MIQYLCPLWCSLIIGLLTSCQIQIYGLTTGVELLTQEERQKVVSTTLPIDSLTADGKVYVVSVDKIKEYTSGGDTVLVYTWVPGCTSEQCTLPSAIERYCQRQNYKCLFLLISITSTDCFAAFDAQHTPLIMPDFSPYGTKYKWKYYPLFTQDMIGKEHDYDIWLFADGRYLKSVRLEELH